MKGTRTALAAALAALTGTDAIQAHHSGSMYQATPVWVTGTVIGFDGINPHTITTVEARGEDGELRRFAIEGPGQAELGRADSGLRAPEPGENIEICAFPYKPAEELSRLFPGVDFSARRTTAAADGSSQQYLAGHVLVMSDGGMRFWEPHGLISECILSSDQPRQSWIAFLDSDGRARRGWCEQREYALVRSSPSLTELVAEIDRAIEYPCE